MSDTAGANKAYFDKLAADYDSRFERTIAQLVEEIQKRRYFISVDWVEEDEDDEDEGNNDDVGLVGGGDDTSLRLLDYACGTGLVSRALAQYTTQCVGIDISENMVAAYNTRAENQGLTKDEMHAFHGNLTDPADPNPAAFAVPNFSGFDVVAVGLGFHHFDDPEYAAKRLVARLKPGGVLLILDFLPHGPVDDLHGNSHGGDHAHGHEHGHGHGHSHGHSHGGDAGTSANNVDGASQTAAHTVMHHGFSEERMRAVFEGAGAGKDFALAELGSGLVFHGHGAKGAKGMKRRVFLARGVKA